MVKKFVLTTVTVALLLVAAVSVIGQSAKREIEEVVTRQFNQQQLILARKIAKDIELQASFLATSLTGLANLWLRDSRDERLFWRDVPPYYEIMRGWDILAVSLIWDWDDTPDLYGADGMVRDIEGLPRDEVLAFAANPLNGPKVFLSKTFKPETGPFAGKWIILMAAPVAPSAVAPEEARAAGRDAPGAIVYVLDALGMARRAASGVRSGQTGYAWVIDHAGVFLSHFEPSFVGENSLTVRARRDPSLSYDRINRLVTDHLLRGEEGMDWYVSGWHRGFVGGEVVKYLAYAPVHLTPQRDGSHTWSVGLAAPDTEVRGLVSRLVARQWVIVGTFMVVVFAGLSAVIFFALRWSQLLAREVETKTREIRAAEREVRRERDKVQESLERLLETQEKLINSERFAAIGEAAAHLSHEIKNPLMLMGGFASQVRRALGEDNPQTRKLAVIEDEARRLENMLTEVRDFTRPAKPQLQASDVNAVVEGTVSFMAADLASRGVTLVFTPAPDLPRAQLDPNQIGQVLFNLIKNAAEAMPGGGRVTVSTHAGRGTVVLRVADNGPGLPPELHGKIFDPFYTTKEKGTGLGLCVCNRIVSDHGGELTIESEPGHGCVFSVSLPAA